MYVIQSDRGNVNFSAVVLVRWKWGLGIDDWPSAEAIACFASPAGLLFSRNNKNGKLRKSSNSRRGPLGERKLRAYRQMIRGRK